MRTLVDLLNGERGYVRIFAERDGFGYELSAYLPRPMADLFERMSGYASARAACEAAQYQLLSMQPVKRMRGRTGKAVRVMTKR